MRVTTPFGGFPRRGAHARRWLLASLLSLLAVALPGQLQAQQSAGEDAPVEDPDVTSPGAAPDSTRDSTKSATLDLDEILNTPSDAYVDKPRCIRVGRIRDTDVIDNQHIAFKVSRSKYYLVQLAFPCPGLRRDSTIMHSSSGQRICELDRVQAVSGYGMSSHVGPPCQIPGFQEITREQLVLLKERLKERRRGDLIDEIEPEGEGVQEEPGNSDPE